MVVGKQLVKSDWKAGDIVHLGGHPSGREECWVSCRALKDGRENPPPARDAAAAGTLGPCAHT